MTPQREEAERFMRMARREEAAFRALLSSTTVDFAVACFYAQLGRVSTPYDSTDCISSDW